MSQAAQIWPREPGDWSVSACGKFVRLRAHPLSIKYPAGIFTVAQAREIAKALLEFAEQVEKA